MDDDIRETGKPEMDEQEKKRLQRYTACEVISVLCPSVSGKFWWEELDMISSNPHNDACVHLIGWEGRVYAFGWTTCILRM